MEESQQQTKYSKVADFFRNNRRKIENYVVTPALMAVSLPLGFAYSLRKNGLGKVLNGAFVGAAISFGLTAGVQGFQTRDVKEFKSPGATVAYEHAFNPPDFSLLTVIATCSGTNYCLGTDLFFPPQNKVTRIEVNGQEGPDVVFCQYKTEGFKSPKEISLDGLKPLVMVNTRELRGEKALEVYGGLCKQVFEEEKKHF